jgi:hypothetical protein
MARIGLLLPRWFPVERKTSVGVDGTSVLAYKSDETTAHATKWTKEEDSTLKEAVEKHNGKDWTAISARFGSSENTVYE